jgi:predicted DNA-binding protein
MAKQKVDTQSVVDAYMSVRSIWEAAKSIGVSGQTVQRILNKAGIERGLKRFSEDDADILRRDYAKFRADRRLCDLAETLGRTRQFICRKAKELGITDISGSYKPVIESVDSMGYVSLRGYKQVNSKHIHRAVAEEKMGRKLLPGEVVHHIDGDKTNNSPENLQVMSNSDHVKLHGLIRRGVVRGGKATVKIEVLQ